MRSNAPKTYQFLLMATILCGLLVLFFGLGSLQLMSLNEGRRALAIKEMFATGNWLLPTQNGELYLTKPPFLYWISLVFSCIVGQVNEWTLRLPSAFAGLSVGIMVYFYTKKYFGAWAALFALQLLIANAGLAMLARRVEIEMLLTALCVGALLSAIQFIESKENGTQKNPNQKNSFWIYLSYLLLGLAGLTKGPVAMLFVTLPLLVTAIWTKNTRTMLVLSNKTGWLIFFIVASTWYLAVTLKLGPDIWSTIAKRDMLEKMQNDDHAKPLLSYLGWIATDFLLLISLFLYKPKTLWRQYQSQLPFFILLLAAILVVVIFSLFSNKHAKYLLPLYPIIIILLSVQLSGIFENTGETFKKCILALGILLPVIFAVFYMLAEPKLFNYRVAVFPQFERWSANLPAKQLYALENTDMRLVYYAHKPIKIISVQQLAILEKSAESAMILLEEKQMDAIGEIQTCPIKTFEPYLKKHKKLVVLGVGSVCTTEK